MYTGLVVKVKVKSEYHSLVQFIMDCLGTYSDPWVDAYHKFGYDFLHRFSLDLRSTFIPFSGYDVMNCKWLTGFLPEDHVSFEDGVWFFGSDIKNYNQRPLTCFWQMS